MAFNSTIQNLEIADNLETVLTLLQDIAPTNQRVTEQLGKISKNRNTYITQLQDKWNAREQPTHCEMDIKTLNTLFYASKMDNEMIAASNGRPQTEMNTRDWVIKSGDKWIGWCAETSQYLDLPILFEGPLDFKRNFEHLVISDKESSSINLIWTIEKILEKGISMSLSNENWIACFLHLAKIYIPTSYQSLSRYSADLEGLFVTLVAGVNADHEISKIRTCMSKLTRRPGEMIQSALFKLRSQYEMLIQISFPGMDASSITLRSDNYTCNCAQYFVSSNTGKICSQYIQYKVSRGDENTVMKLSNLITQHEALNPTDRITSTHTLPDDACKLDLQMYTCTNVEQLMVQTAQLNRAGRRSESAQKQSRGNTRSPSQHKEYRDKNRSKSPLPDRKYRQGSRVRETRKRDPNQEKVYKKGYRSKSSSLDRNKQYRSQSKHDDRGDRNSYRTKRQEKSKSPTSGYRGKSPDQLVCFRCGDPHYAKECPRYLYYDGPSCSVCGFKHKTRDHRQRSSSREKNTQNLGARKKVINHIPDFKYRDTENYNLQIRESDLQSEENANSNLFKTKN